MVAIRRRGIQWPPSIAVMDFTLSLCMALSPNNILLIINGLFQIQKPYIKIGQCLNGVFRLSGHCHLNLQNTDGIKKNERQILIKRFLSTLKV